MSDGNKMEIDLDPQKVLASLKKMGEESMNLAKQIEESLGKNAAKNIKDFEKTAEEGSNRIATFFRDLGKKVKEDMKTAFDATGVLAGAKFARELGEGVRQVFDLEKAFDKLNTRLGLVGKTYQDFKRQLGSKVAATGQDMKDIFPGVEAVAAKGGVKDAGQLSSIGEMLAQARATTGESTEGLAESIVETLKNQGKDINAGNFKQTLDAIQGTRVSGAFHNAGEAASLIQELSQYKGVKGTTRELGGLAAVSSKAGEGGQNILKQLFQQGTTVAGQQRLNAVFGQNVFNKQGGVDATAISKIDKNRFGQYSQQAMESATGLTGANGADLSRFIDAFKSGIGEFDEVTKGANETAKQFEGATDNLGSKIDKFKQNVVNSTRTVFSDLSNAGKEALKGNFSGAAGSVGQAGKDAWENKGTIGTAIGLTAAVGTLAGGGLGSLLGKAGAGTGLGLLKGKAAEQAGVQPVYVVNAAEIGTGAGGIPGAMGPASKLGMLGKGLAGAGAAFSLGTAGYDAYQAATGEGVTTEQKGGAYGGATGSALGLAAGAFVGGPAGAMLGATLGKEVGELLGKVLADAFNPEKVSTAVAKGVEQGNGKSAKPTVFTNPSTVTGRGAGY